MSEQKLRESKFGKGRAGGNRTGSRFEVPQPAIGQRRVYRMRELCEAFRISDFTARRLMKQGKLPYVKLGKLLLIPADGAEALLRPEKIVHP
jgi:excisionase family DNA binding protein